MLLYIALVFDRSKMSELKKMGLAMYQTRINCIPVGYTAPVSLEVIAEKLHVRRDTWSKVERGEKDIGFEKICAFWRLYGVEYKQFLTPCMGISDDTWSDCRYLIGLNQELLEKSWEETWGLMRYYYYANTYMCDEIEKLKKVVQKLRRDIDKYM